MQPRRRGKRIQHPVTGAASFSSSAGAAAADFLHIPLLRFPSSSPRRLPSRCCLPVPIRLALASLQEPKHPQRQRSPRQRGRMGSRAARPPASAWAGMVCGGERDSVKRVVDLWGCPGSREFGNDRGPVRGLNPQPLSGMK
jgi:hypothetical protein